MDIGEYVCVGELCTLKPLFPGQNDIDQISRVFQIMGTPTPTNWPEAVELPDYSKIIFPVMHPLPWELIFPHLTPADIGFLTLTLQLNPARRATASQVGVLSGGMCPRGRTDCSLCVRIDTAGAWRLFLSAAAGSVLPGRPAPAEAPERSRAQVQTVAAQCFILCVWCYIMCNEECKLVSLYTTHPYGTKEQSNYGLIYTDRRGGAYLGARAGPWVMPPPPAPSWICTPLSVCGRYGPLS